MGLQLLLVTNLYPPQELGGYGRSMADFRWALERLGHKVTVVSSDAAYLGPIQQPELRVARDLQLKGSFENGVKMATPLLVVVAVIEFTDLIFAVDSIPAIFAIAPDDPFILYTSNIFAILGLRSLYFLLANFIHMFSRLKFGLAIILSFIGFKMIIAPFYHISSPLSLSVVGSILILSVAASILFPVKESAS